jgi:anti-sigma B factor antagonist
MKASFQIAEESQGGATVLRARGELDLATAGQLRDPLLRAFDGRPKAVILDMASLLYLDSAGVAVLVEGYLKAKKTKVPYRLSGVGPTVRGILEMARLLEVFEIRDDVARALTG